MEGPRGLINAGAQSHLCFEWQALAIRRALAEAMKGSGDAEFPSPLSAPQALGEQPGSLANALLPSPSLMA